MTVHIKFGQNVGARPDHSSPQVMDAKHGTQHYIAPGAVSGECPDPIGFAHPMVRVFNNNGAPVYISVGQNPDPNAATDAGRIMIGDQGVEYFFISAGDKVSVASI